MTSLIWIFFFQMAISLFAYVATFTGQLYFWRGYSFALLQSNYFDTTVYFSERAISSEQLFFFFRSSFFGLVTYLLQSFFQNGYFFRAKFLPCKRFLRIESFLGQLTAILLAEDFIRINISTEILLFRNRYFCIALTFSEKQSFGKS